MKLPDWFRRRGAVILMVALAGMVVFPVTASANYNTTYQNWHGHTYTSNQDCPWMSTTLQDFGGQPNMSTYGSIDWWGGYNCGNTNATADSYMAIRQDLYKWTGSYWAICNYGPWIYNSPVPTDPNTGYGSVHSITTGYGWSNPPCGIGYYDDNAASYYENNVDPNYFHWDGSWQATGWIWTA